ncbi:MAG: alpha/beta hydrolase [Nitrospira sp.]|nr:alpha/beta hydrolase [Nitrospira sp.]
MGILDQFFVYYPKPWQDRDWAKISGLPLEDVWFQSGDGVRLFGWYVESRADRPVMLWCHGNAGNIIHRLENLSHLYRMGLSVFLFDYRGYGKSQNDDPSESGLYQDAIGAYDWLTRARKIPSSRVCLFGRSLGAAVAGELAVQRSAAALILESSFPSIESVARHHYAGLPVHWFLAARFRLIDRLPHLSLPKLIIHGDQDDIIPLKLGRQVYEAAKPPKDWYIVAGAGHNDTYQVGGEAYFRRLGDFMTKALAM